MLLPTPTYTSTIILRGTLDHDPDLPRALHRTRLRDRHANPRHAELGHDDSRDGFGQRLDELILRASDEGGDPFRDFLVVERIVDPIGDRRAAHVGRHLEIDADDLLDPALPLPDTDDGLDAQVAHEHDVQGALLVYSTRRG